MSNGLQHLTAMRELNVCYNGIEGAGFDALVQTLVRMPVLCRLDLSQNADKDAVAANAA